MKLAYRLTTGAQLVVSTWLGIACGACLAQGGTWLFVLHFGCITCATIVLLRASRRSGLAAFVALFLFQLASFWAALSWLGDALSRDDALANTLGNGVFLLLCTWLTLPIVAGAFLGCVISRRSRSTWVSSALIASGFALGEFARARISGGFAWAQPGYAYLDSPIAALYSVVGVMGVTWLVLFAAVNLGIRIESEIHHRRPPGPRLRHSATLVGAVSAIVLLASLAHLHELQGEVQVRLIQTNVAWHEKFAPLVFRRDVFKLAASIASDPANADDQLIVTPETAIPMPWYQLPLDLRTALNQAVFKARAPVLLGILDFDEAIGPVNRTVVLESTRRDSMRLPNKTYAKRTLVPLGEVVPFGLGWLDDLLALPSNQRSIGPVGQSVLRIGDLDIKPSICLDAVAPGVLHVDTDFGFLVNQANFAWFRDNAVLEQWIAILRARALELRKSIVAVSNSGPSAVIDPNGRVIARSRGRGFEVMTVSAPIARGRTPYAVLGDAWLVVLSGLACLALAIELWLRRRTTLGASGAATLPCPPQSVCNT